MEGEPQDPKVTTASVSGVSPSSLLQCESNLPGSPTRRCFSCSPGTNRQSQAGAHPAARHHRQNPAANLARAFLLSFLLPGEKTAFEREKKKKTKKKIPTKPQPRTETEADITTWDAVHRQELYLPAAACERPGTGARTVPAGVCWRLLLVLSSCIVQNRGRLPPALPGRPQVPGRRCHRLPCPRPPPHPSHRPPGARKAAVALRRASRPQNLLCSLLGPGAKPQSTPAAPGTPSRWCRGVSFLGEKAGLFLNSTVWIFTSAKERSSSAVLSSLVAAQVQKQEEKIATRPKRSSREEQTSPTPAHQLPPSSPPGVPREPHHGVGPQGRQKKGGQIHSFFSPLMQIEKYLTGREQSSKSTLQRLPFRYGSRRGEGEISASRVGSADSPTATAKKCFSSLPFYKLSLV